MRDEDGALRLLCPQPTYASLIGVAFNQIRQNASGVPIVAIHLLEAVTRVAKHTRLETQREALRLHLAAIAAAAERDTADEIDRAAIAARADAARAALGAPAATDGASTSAG